MKNTIKKISVNTICFFIPLKKNRHRIRNKILEKNKRLIKLIYKNKKEKNILMLL